MVMIVAAALVLGAAAGGQVSGQAEALLQKAIQAETVDGNLKAAIGLYEQAVAAAGSNRPVAARALVQMGQCYEKLGSVEAQKAYQRVVQDFADQADPLKLARARLAALTAAPREASSLPAIRLLWSGPGADFGGAPSPDGKSLSFTDWSTGDLAVRDLESGQNRRLTNKGPWEQSSEEADASLWSPDGTQIAYEWETAGNQRLELRVIGLGGSGLRTLYAAGENEWATLYDWSPDGKHILAFLPGNQLSLLSVTDGTTTALKSLESASTRAAFSPDGRYLVFDAPQAGDPLRRDIFTLSIADKRETPLVVHSADDRVLGWTPDGQAVLFNSDRTGSGAFWAIPVADGKTRGSAQMIRAVSNRTAPMGFTRDGRFFYGEAKGGADIYGVSLDAATGKVLGPPERIIDRFEGFNVSPSYSPNGASLAYCSWRGSRRPSLGGPIGVLGNVLCIRSMATGEDQELSKALTTLGISSISNPRWAPDGRFVLVYGFAEPMGGFGGIYVVDLQLGNATRVTYSSEDVKVGGAEWLSDGRTIVFLRFDTKRHLVHLVARKLETGDERIVREWPESANPDMAVSPNYQRLCVSVVEGGGRVFWIMEATGGEPRRLEGTGGTFRGFTWSADGKHVLYTRRGADAGWQLWRVSVDGGDPELLGLSESSRIAHLSASPDGRRLLFSRRGPGGAEVWVMENALPVAKKTPAASPHQVKQQNR
jgi:Tol biopolymer transport system component